MLSYLQCDQLVEFEVAQFFTKVAQKVDTAVFTYLNRDIFQISQNSTDIWATFVRKFVYM